MNHQTTFLLLFLGAIITLWMGCTNVYYPTTLNTPLFEEEGERIVDVSFNSGCFVVSGGYAMREHFALSGQVSAFTLYDEAGYVNGGESLQFDIAPGYFTKFGPQIIFETYTGYGIGRTIADDFDGMLHKFYIQPNVGFRGERLHGAFSLRMMNVLFDARDPLFELGNVTYIEPAVTAKFGSNRFRFTTQVGGSFPVNANYYNPDFSFIVSIGWAYLF